MAQSYLFSNAHLIDPSVGIDTVCNIAIVDGVIQEIGKVNSIPGAENIDLSGRHIVPGFCDMHVHLREPGFEYKETIESGAAAAAAGGFTAVACMPNTKPSIDTAEVVSAILAKSKALAVDVHPIAAVTRKREGQELSPMAELAKAGAVGFSDDGNPVSNSELLRIALEYSSMFGVPIIQHAEDKALASDGVMHEGYYSTMLGMPGIPSIAEETMIARDIAIAAYTGGRYHAAHISTAGSAELMRRAKREGYSVTCEVTPHHFSLCDDAVIGYDTNTKMNPPLRSRDDVQAMIEALRDGTIDAIATDHAPHATFEKEVEYIDAPFGIVGLETAIGLCITELVVPGYIALADLIEKLSTNPRRILNLSPARIEAGMEANLTFLDMNAEWIVDASKFKSLSTNTPFNGRALKGKAFGIFNKGRFVQV